MIDIPAAGGFSGQTPDRVSAGGRARELASDYPDGLAIRAEQALLGSVMSDPGQAGVLDLVRAEDMMRPYHGQVLAAIQRLRGRGVAPEPVAVRAELALDPDLPPSVSRDGMLLINLLEAAPASAYAAAYAAMVIERGIRQDVALAASRMVQAAEAGELDGALRIVAEACRFVRNGQARWEALPERMRRELPEGAARRSVLAEEAAWQLRAASNEISQARQDAESDAHADLADRLAAIGRHVQSAAGLAMRPHVTPRGRLLNRGLPGPRRKLPGALSSAIWLPTRARWRPSVPGFDRTTSPGLRTAICTR